MSRNYIWHGIEPTDLNARLIGGGIRAAFMGIGVETVARVWPDGTFAIGAKRLLPQSSREGQLSLAPPPTDECQRDSSPLGLSLPANSHRPVTRRGLKGISTFGAKMVRNGAHLLQEEYGRKQLTFLTLTLPSLSSDEQETIATQWSEVLRVFNQRLRRELLRKGLPGEIVSVTEIQEKRLQHSGGVPLHVHSVFVGRRRGKGWLLTPEKIRGFWKDTIQPRLTRQVDFSSTENLQQVRKNAAGYLGKYMSKGSQAVKQLAEQGLSEAIPSSWWNMSSTLKGRVKRLTLTGKCAAIALRALVEGYTGWGEMTPFAYIAPFVKEFGEHKVTLAWYGTLKKKALRSLYQAAEELRPAMKYLDNSWA